MEHVLHTEHRRPNGAVAVHPEAPTLDARPGGMNLSEISRTIGSPIGDDGVIIEQVESTQAVRICAEIGLRFPLHNNAPGKVLLAFQPAKGREESIQRLKLARFTDRTITTRDALRQECERVVKLGYGTDWGEADEGIHCVAAPVFDRPDHLMATVWVSAVAGRLKKSRFASVAEEVMQTAREIERRLRA